ncbi:hypothetical protein [Algibacter aquimarinus]|uniref:Uncharacterized protein n=1 Tax=Algibacter aquimarinus TaxID=1136748 RepID=A0ABP9H8G5_9FLAO
MELALKIDDLEPLPKQNKDLICEPLGFLNSEYKSVVKDSLKSSSSKSIFGIKQRIKSRSYLTSCVAETTIKLSVFLTVILLIFN